MLTPNTENDDFGRVLSEAPIKISVGKENTIFYVHPGVLLKCMSPSDGQRLSGYWATAGNDMIDWTVFDKETIGCVLQYLYTGDYHVLRWKAETPWSFDEPEERREEEQKGNNQAGGPSSITETRGPSDASLEPPPSPVVSRAEVDAPGEELSAASQLEAKYIKERNKGFEHLILIHGKVYAFAYLNTFSAMKAMALKRLTQVLDLAHAQPSMVPCLADASRHVYQVTLDSSQEMNPARKLLSEYVANNFIALQSPELAAFAGQGGAFWMEVIPTLAQMLQTQKTEVPRLQEDNLKLGVMCIDLKTKVKSLQEELAGIRITNANEEFEMQKARDMAAPREGSRRASKDKRRNIFGGSILDSKHYQSNSHP